MEILIYYLSYFLTFTGYLLGKSTLEEHKEIKKKVILISNVLIVLFYLGLVYLFLFSKVLVLILLLIVGFYYSYKKNNSEFHDIILFGLSFSLLYIYQFDYIFLILLLMMSLIFKKSFEKFHFKKEIYSIIILLAIFIIFDVITKSF